MSFIRGFLSNVEDHPVEHLVQPAVKGESSRLLGLLSTVSLPEFSVPALPALPDWRRLQLPTLPKSLSGLRLPSNRQLAYVGAGAAVSIGGLVAIRSYRRSRRNAVHGGGHIIPSPLKSALPGLSEDEIDDLPYPPDILPGARDVDTPYGSIRVYEWGPESGRKIMFVHGISTPCVSLSLVANRLAHKGCRVMLFDLFGRGYSDAPADVPYDSRLYTTQMLLALASSPIPWTGGTTFALVGYSLGGGLCADFTSHFPQHVSSLVLVAPGGILRTSHITWKSRLLYDWSQGYFVPSRLVDWLVHKRIHTPVDAPPSVEPDADSAVRAEAGRGRPSVEANHATHDPLFPEHPASTVANIVNWQLASHGGFLHAFISSIRHAPIHAQNARWRLIGQRASQERLAALSSGRDADRMRKKVLLVLGADDPIVNAEEVAADAREALGDENVEVLALDAGHDVPIAKSKELAHLILKFWGVHDKAPRRSDPPLPALPKKDKRDKEKERKRDEERHEPPAPKSAKSEDSRSEKSEKKRRKSRGFFR